MDMANSNLGSPMQGGMTPDEKRDTPHLVSVPIFYRHRLRIQSSPLLHLPPSCPFSAAYNDSPTQSPG